MADQQQRKASSFGTKLADYISNRLPYSNQEDELNTKYKHFAKNGQQRAEALVKSSV